MKAAYLISSKTIFFVFFVLLVTSALSVNFLRHFYEEEMRQKCYHDRLVFNFRVAENIPENAIVFIGDSFVQGLCVAAVTPYGVNLGIGRDTTSGVLQRISQYGLIGRAKAIIVTVGINDLIQGFQDGIAERYELILQFIPRHVPVVLSAILPVDEQATLKVKNRDIVLVNRAISDVCSRYENCYFSEFAKNSIDFSGNLASKYHVGDGIHLNSRGYRIWISKLKNILADIRV